MKKINLIRLLVLGVVLITSVTNINAWDCGWWDTGTAAVTFDMNGTEKSIGTVDRNHASAYDDLELGTVSSKLEIKSAWGKTWGKNSGGSFIYSMWLYYRVKEQDAESETAFSEYQIDWDNDFGDNNSYWEKSINVCPINGFAPGDYEIEYYMKVYPKQDHYVEYADLNNGGSNYHANFTIPSKDLTVTTDDTHGCTVSGDVTGVAKGTAYTITATPALGYRFKGWTATSGGSSVTIADASSATTTVTFNNFSNNVTIKAEFEVKWVIKGTMSNDGWSTAYELSNATGNTRSCAIDITTTGDHELKIWDRDGGNPYGCSATITSSTYEYNFYNESSTPNLVLRVATTGTYHFNWDEDNHQLAIMYPDLPAKKIITKNTILYFDATNANSSGWQNKDFTARFWFKYYDSGLDHGSVDCEKSNAIGVDWMYFAQVPNNDYIGRVQMNRINPSDDEDIWCSVYIDYAYERENGDENCLAISSDDAGKCGSFRPEWTYYRPPMKSASLTNDGTQTVTYGGDGGEETPFLVATGSSIYVTATSTSSVTDTQMTPYYQFKKEDSADGDESSTETHTYTASGTTGTKEAMTVVARNKYHNDYGTASPASDAIYYEARTPYSVTHTLNGVTTKSGETGSGATVYGAVYNATFEASAGYALPSTITVTNGGSALTATTDYTWNQSTGALQILADKITGNIVITINGVPQDLTFNATKNSYWSEKDNWSPACVPTIGHDVIIAKPVIVDIANARAKSVVIYNNGTTKTGQLNIGAGKELVIATTLKKTTDGLSYTATSENDIVLGSTLELGNGALVIGTYSVANQATVTFCSLSHGSAGSTGSVNQYVGIPFAEGTVLGCFYNSWVYEIDYSKTPIEWKRTEDKLYPFVGYSVIYNGSAGNTYWMDGTLVPTTDKTCSSLHNVNADASDWKNENLLANSWTAPIKINAMQASDFTNANATIYIFNSGSPSDYSELKELTGSGAAQYNTYPVASAGSAVIPSMQSFSVFTTASGGSLALDYSKIVYDPAIAGTVPSANKAPKRTAEEMDKVRIYVEGESGYRDMIYMLEDAEQFTEGFDNGWDGRKLFGLDVAPQFYALSTDGNMAVAAVPDMDGTVLGFKAGNQDSEYTISFDYEGTNTLYLYDTQTKQETRVSAENTYTFTTTDEVAHNRFVLSKSAKVPTGVENTGSEGVKVVKFIENGELYILRDGKLYNATGALVK